MNAYDVIISPLVSEKSVESIKQKKYAFKVLPSATKRQIKDAVEKVFGVQVEYVNTLNYDGKVKRQGRFEGRESAWKKAYVQLKKTSKSIEFFDGLQ
ncbi:MAG: 50S ribosomal protein L23 [Christensenellaceae bacterium]|jgi:large subunit ribosomal protein L23|nr:50S ribosomal protein L23 [Christensenellaceae bacterium]